MSHYDAPYVADCAVDAEPFDLKALEEAALARLDGDPGHPHRFVVE